MNIIINEYCNLHCPYCFAQEAMTLHNTMTEENYIYILNFLQRNNQMDEVRIIGGEPTLHPNFIKFCQIAKDMSFKSILVFTNGTFSDDICDELIYLNSTGIEVNFLINYNKEEISGKYFPQIKKNIFKLHHGGCRVTLGINFYNPNQDYQYIIDMTEILERKVIRWALAIPNSKVDYLEYFNSMKQLLYNFFEDCRKLKIIPHIDCNNIPLCGIDNLDEMKELLANYPDIFLKEPCKPVIDINSQLKITRCFGVSELASLNLKDVQSISEINEYFNKEFFDLMHKPLYIKCLNCKVYRNNDNSSCGCLAYRTLNK